jgi:hypothetical protein
MNLTATAPMLGIGEWHLIDASCFSLLEVVIEIIASPEKAVEPTGEARSPLFTAALVNKDEARVGVSIIRQ